MVDTISIQCSAMQSSDSLSVASGNGSLQSRHAVSGSRKQLDKIFLLDASLSITFGIISLLSPHRFISALNGGSYNHSAHEALRLVCFPFHHSRSYLLISYSTTNFLYFPILLTFQDVLF